MCLSADERSGKLSLKCGQWPKPSKKKEKKNLGSFFVTQTYHLSKSNASVVYSHI